MKYIKLFNNVYDASSATDLVSPNVTYISGSEKMLMKDSGTDGAELQINVDASGNIGIDEKSSWDGVTWKFNDYISMSALYINESFTSDNTHFDKIEFVEGGSGPEDYYNQVQYINTTGNTLAYVYSAMFKIGWVGSGQYQIVKFDSPVTDEYYLGILNSIAKPYIPE